MGPKRDALLAADISSTPRDAFCRLKEAAETELEAETAILKAKIGTFEANFRREDDARSAPNPAFSNGQSRVPAREGKRRKLTRAGVKSTGQPVTRQVNFLDLP